MAYYVKDHRRHRKFETKKNTQSIGGRIKGENGEKGRHGERE